MFSSTPLFAAFSKFTAKTGAPAVSALRVLGADQLGQVSGGKGVGTTPTPAQTPTKGW